MCTISSIASGNKMIFTFNRDEDPGRNATEYMAKKQLPNKTIYFPKDPLSGGSWMVADNRGNVAMLFNGALQKYEKTGNYKQSRGILLLETGSEENMLDAFTKKDLEGIEPFSILLYENRKLYRLIWNGNEKNCSLLPKNQNHIFSSATIYTQAVRQLRETWLEQYAKQNRLHEASMFHFHKNMQPQDMENGLVINRSNRLQTISITQAVISDSNTIINQEDLINNQLHQSTIEHELVNC
jgi:hypothetical protein